MTLTYNDLPTVEYASEQLSLRSEFPQFLEEFASVAYSAGVSDVVGAFLLHRHFYLAVDEDICEGYSFDDTPRLSSAPTPRRPGSDHLPHRWALTDESW